MPSISLHPIARFLLALSPILLIVGRAPLEIAIASIGLLFLAHSLKSKHYDWLKTPWVKAALLLWVYICLRNVFVEEETLKSVLSGASWVRYPLFGAALAFWILPDKKAQSMLVKGLAAGLSFLLFDGFYQYITGADILGHAAWQSAYHTRLTGPFSFPRLGIITCWLFFPITAWLLKNAMHKGLGQKLLAAAFYLSAIAIIFLSGDRMAFIFAAFGSGLLFLIVPQTRKLLLMFGMGVGLLIAIIATYDPTAFQRQIGQTTTAIDQFSKSQGSAYASSFETAWGLTLNHPLFGVGGKQYQTSCQQEMQSNNPDAFCGLHPHNFYLDWLAEYGFIGMGFMLWILFHWLRPAFTHWQAIKTDIVAAALLVTLIIRFWPIASVTSQVTLWSGFPQFLMVGWFIAYLHHHISPPKR